MTGLPPTAPPPVRVRAHDRLQLEIKSELLCESVALERISWTVDLWFVLPQATGIAPGSYSNDEFYEDLRSYMRLKTPVVPMEELVSLRGKGSPLATLSLLATRARGSGLTSAERKLLVQEAKLLPAILKSQLREWSEQHDAREGAARLPVCEELASLLSELDANWSRVRDELLRVATRPKSRDALWFADESLSIQIEEAALEQILLLPRGQRRAPGAESLKELALTEQKRRAAKGWRSVLDAGQLDGSYVDQARLLKKYISSVLHLHLKANRWDGLARQGVFALAAGLAMLWAVVAQVVMFISFDLQLQRGVSMGFLATFCGIWVVTYILKDRIKAGTASALNRRLPAFMSDRRHDLLLPELGDEAIGQVSERMAFERSSELPEEIAALHTASARNHLLLLADQDVLRYTRQIELYPKDASRAFPRIDGLTDILRVNVWRWIRTYARARKQVPYLDDEGRVRTRKLSNLYYVDVIVRFQQRGPREHSRLAQVRVALNRRGLVRVDEVSSVP